MLGLKLKYISKRSPWSDAGSLDYLQILTLNLVLINKDFQTWLI